MPGNRRAWADNVLLATGTASVSAIMFSYFVIGGRPNAAEMIAWAGATIGLMIVLRVYQRVTAEQRQTIARLNEHLQNRLNTRKCAACEYSADWFSVLMHEGAVHGL